MPALEIQAEADNNFGSYGVLGDIPLSVASVPAPPVTGRTGVFVSSSGRRSVGKSDAELEKEDPTKVFSAWSTQSTGAKHNAHGCENRACSCQVKQSRTYIFAQRCCYNGCGLITRRAAFSAAFSAGVQQCRACLCCCYKRFEAALSRKPHC